MTSLKTNRLIIRNPQETDFVDWHRLMSDAKTMYYLDDIMTHSKEESQQNLDEAIADIANKNRSKYFFAIELAQTGKFVGTIGYTVLHDTTIGKIVHAGYFILPEYNNNGYTTEALNELLRFAFEDNNVYRFQTGCFAENKPSERVMQKCSLIRESYAKECEWHDGCLKDRVSYRMLKSEWETRNKSHLQSVIPTDFSGCILITQDRKTLLENSYGYSDLSNKIPNAINTRFATASAGKVFVAVAILQLIEAEKLRFDSTLGELLDFDLKAIDPYITIEQLLTHTSGIPDYFDETIMEDYDELWRDYPNYKIRRSADLIPLFIDKPMLYPKGERFQYNNTGFVVLGLIIEKLTGVSFDKHLEMCIFTPCGMNDTGYFELDRLPERCANSYIYDCKSDKYYTNIYSVDVKGTGAGGAFTTVLDVQRFWDALLSYRLLSEDMTKNMISLHARNGNEYYGYGIWLDKATNGKFTPHFEGCDPGVSFISSYDNESKLFITAVSNFGCNVWKLRRNILSEIERGEKQLWQQ